jgi:protein-disulfide isomerase
MKKEVRTLILIAIIVVLVGVAGTLVYRQSSQNAAAPLQQRPDNTEKLVRPDSATLGPADAKVTVVEFLDPECEACAAFAPTVKKIISDYPQVRFVFRYMPFHRNARLAASYIEAAGEQGKYWEMTDIMLRKQSEWGEIHGPGPQPVRPPAETVFQSFGKEIGLDIDQLKSSADDPKHGAKADRDMKDGRELGVRKTPSFFVNGRLMPGLDERTLRAMINEELAKQP